jgi:hypothetical protein
MFFLPTIFIKFGRVSNDARDFVKVHKFGLVLGVGTQHDLLFCPVKKFPHLDQDSLERFALTTGLAKTNQPVFKLTVFHDDTFTENITRTFPQILIGSPGLRMFRIRKISNRPPLGKESPIGKMGTHTLSSAHLIRPEEPFRYFTKSVFDVMAGAL